MRWELQGCELGRSGWRLVAEWLAGRWTAVARIRLAVVDTNARVATPFWERMGFAPTGEQKPYRYDKLESTVRLMEKPLRP